VYFFSFGLFQVPLGLLLDRFGPRRVNGALLVLAAAGGIAEHASRAAWRRAVTMLVLGVALTAVKSLPFVEVSRFMARTSSCVSRPAVPLPTATASCRCSPTASTPACSTPPRV